MKEYQLKIGATEITIRSDESPEHVASVQALVQQAMLDAGAESGRAHYTALSFAALSLADQLLKERSAHKALKERIRSRSRDLLRTLASRSLEPFSKPNGAVNSDTSLVA